MISMAFGIVLLIAHVWLAWWASGVAARKGYPRVLGFLLALVFPLVGTLVILLLPRTRLFEG